MIKIILGLIVLAIFSIWVYAYTTNQNFNELALTVFSQVKKWKGEKVDFQKLSKTERPIVSHDLWDQLLQKQVDSTGFVDYTGMLQKEEKLQAYLTILSESPPGSNWSEAERLAYWINAYNAFTVRLILDHFPLQSIKDISSGLPMINSPWDIKFFKIGGIDFDLNTIEHDILRNQFAEPRIHFAINCASFSCPKLRNEAYVAVRLEEQLHDQTLSFINDPEKNTIGEKQLVLSQIFNWFPNDFQQGQTLVEFVQKYTSLKLDPKLEISYGEYLWHLNGK